MYVSTKANNSSADSKLRAVIPKVIFTLIGEYTFRVTIKRYFLYEQIAQIIMITVNFVLIVG